MFAIPSSPTPALLPNTPELGRPLEQHRDVPPDRLNVHLEALQKLVVQIHRPLETFRVHEPDVPVVVGRLEDRLDGPDCPEPFVQVLLGDF